MTKLNIVQIKNLIDEVKYHIVPGTTTTIASAILKNGFVVNGQSACIHEEDFSEEEGRRIALDDAVRQIWQLEAYRVIDSQHVRAEAA